MLERGNCGLLNSDFQNGFVALERASGDPEMRHFVIQYSHGSTVYLRLAERRAAKRVTPTFERAAVEVHASLKCDGPHDVADAGRDHCHPSPSVSNRVDDLTRPHLPRIR